MLAAAKAQGASQGGGPVEAEKGEAAGGGNLPIHTVLCEVIASIRASGRSLGGGEREVEEAWEGGGGF